MIKGILAWDEALGPGLLAPIGVFGNCVSINVSEAAPLLGPLFLPLHPQPSWLQEMGPDGLESRSGPALLSGGACTGWAWVPHEGGCRLLETAGRGLWGPEADPHDQGVWGTESSFGGGEVGGASLSTAPG